MSLRRARLSPNTVRQSAHNPASHPRREETATSRHGKLLSAACQSPSSALVPCRHSVWSKAGLPRPRPPAAQGGHSSPSCQAVPTQAGPELLPRRRRGYTSLPTANSWTSLVTCVQVLKAPPGPAYSADYKRVMDKMRLSSRAARARLLM